MKCRDLVERIADYTEGSLGLNQSQEIEGHLQHCQACSAFLNTYKAVSTLGKELPIQNPSHPLQLISKEV